MNKRLVGTFAFLLPIPELQPHVHFPFNFLLMQTLEAAVRPPVTEFLALGFSLAQLQRL